MINSPCVQFIKAYKCLFPDNLPSFPSPKLTNFSNHHPIYQLFLSLNQTIILDESWEISGKPTPMGVLSF
jgi:hypothetical protein